MADHNAAQQRHSNGGGAVGGSTSTFGSSASAATASSQPTAADPTPNAGNDSDRLQQQQQSVFGDFQRMWVQRFPQSSLSDAWELDVRASLQRHRGRIAELTKELEQEQLYVEYLERLLGDVERQRELDAVGGGRNECVKCE